jgi:hypothetical protein
MLSSSLAIVSSESLFEGSVESGTSGVWPSTPNAAPITNCQFDSFDFSSLASQYYTYVDDQTAASYSLQLCRGLIVSRDTETDTSWLVCDAV